MNYEFLDYYVEHRPSWDTSNVMPWIPRAPFVPNEEPAVIQIAYNHEQLKEYRLQNQPYIVRAHYDLVLEMLEAGIMKKHERDYQEWQAWVEANL